MTLSISYLIYILLVVISLTYSRAMSVEEKAKIYSVFAEGNTIEDGSEEDVLCFNESLHPSLCPADETISCGPIKGIMQFCEQQVGTKDTVALKGCINYVGYYIIDEDHLACCPSAVCDEWLDDMIQKMDLDVIEIDDELSDVNLTLDDIDDDLNEEDDMDDEF